MTTPSLAPDEAPTSRKPSVEHIVLGAVLLAVILGAAGWFLLKPGSSSTAAAKAATPTPTVAVTMTPTVAPTTTAAAKVAHHVSKPLTKVAYLKAGNAICTAMNAAAKANGPYPKTMALESAWIIKQDKIEAPGLKRLEALPAPAAKAAAYRKLYANEAHVDAIVLKFGAALHAGNGPLAQTYLTALNSANTKLNAEYIADGLKVCGES